MGRNEELRLMNAHDTFETPQGRFTVIVREDGAVLAAAFGAVEEMRHLIGSAEVTHDRVVTAEARGQVEEYFAGARTRFELPLAEPATDFQRRYRQEMEGLEFGRTTTYGDLARNLGSSARAAGRANATNPLCIIVPCHRVIGADGSLTGYGGGLERKRWLLDHERRWTDVDGG
jgi:methylated-DNA-[protein]-cysteine S-methyltransferase